MAQKPKQVRVRFLRTHYPAGQFNPYTIGQEVELEAEEARGLATYGIVQVLVDPEEATSVPKRLPAKAAVTRIEQLMPAADQGEAAAIAELEQIRDAELADGEKPRDSVLAALRSAKVQGLPGDTD